MVPKILKNVLLSWKHCTSGHQSLLPSVAVGMVWLHETKHYIYEVATEPAAGSRKIMSKELAAGTSRIIEQNRQEVEL